jgi:hypothetical protein
MMARRRKTKWKWSYNTGERGQNWVRACCKGCESSCVRETHHSGAFYLEWRESVQDSDGTCRVRRPSVLLKGVTATAESKRRADELAARFAALTPPLHTPLTIK